MVGVGYGGGGGGVWGLRGWGMGVEGVGYGEPVPPFPPPLYNYYQVPCLSIRFLVPLAPVAFYIST